ncbi:MAG: hypothetical protein J6Y90_03405 [Lachnospiraceae bacterium]|nr:hypothetical protein [Lachnospiraceae bacterium]
MRRSNSHAAGAAMLAWLLAAGMVSAPVAAIAAPVAVSEESIASGFSEDIAGVGTETTGSLRTVDDTRTGAGPAQDAADLVSGAENPAKTYSPPHLTTDSTQEDNTTASIGGPLSGQDETGDNLTSSVTQEADLSITQSPGLATEYTAGYSNEYKESINVSLASLGITYIYHNEEDGADAVVAFSSKNKPDYDDSVVEEVIFNPLIPKKDSDTTDIGDSSHEPSYTQGNPGSNVEYPDDIVIGTDPAGAIQRGSVDSFLTFFEQLDEKESHFYSYIDSFDEHTLMDNSYDSSMPSTERVYIPYELPADEYVYIPCTKAEFEARTYRTSEAYQNFYVNKVKAYDCWLKDNPKVFWSNGINTITRLKYDEARGAAVIRQIDFALRQYYKGILDEVEDVESALVNAYESVRRRIGSDTSRIAVFRETERYINSLMHYNSQAASSSDMNTYGFAHTITGPLLTKYDNSGVCEGYSKLFKIICDEFKAPSIIVIGKSYSSLQNMDHMWNYALMDNGEWYLVD